MREGRLEELVERALDMRAAGQVVDFEFLCREDPELAPELRRIVDLDDAVDFVPSEDALVGTRIDGRYVVHRCIGVGAMGAVYAATDLNLNRGVAVKVLQNGLFASQERHERFTREAQVLAALKHPNIVRVYDHGRAEAGLHYIVMEHLRGVPLASVLHQAEIDGRKTSRALDGAWLRQHFDIEIAGLSYIPQVVFWCSQVADALRVAHEAGVTHRDVKPTNIFIDEGGSAILLDFGIAAREGDGTLTAQGSTVGTPWYMAPEQVGGRARVSKRADVYGLAATLYHLATCRPPYEGDYAEVLAQLLHSDPKAPRRVRPELSRDLCAVIERGMERQPRRRYASMSDFADDLRALYRQLPVRARPVGRMARVLRSARRRPGPWVAAVLTILAVLVTIPLAKSWAESERTELDARAGARRALLAGLAPSCAFEGKPSARRLLPRVERERDLAQLTDILAIDGADRFARLLLSALLLDGGDHAASVLELERVCESPPTELQRALMQRYRAMDVDTSSVVELALSDLPVVESDVDRLMLGFQLKRQKRDEEAEAVLAPAQILPARNVRLGVLLVLAHKAFVASEDRSSFEVLLS